MALRKKSTITPMTFILDPSNNELSPLQIIASRDDFLDTAPKRPGLRDVIFSGGFYTKVAKPGSTRA